MKTIKLSLLGILYLFISVLLLRYAVISINYITTFFTTTSDKEPINFGITFAVQGTILIALALLCIANAIKAFTLSYTYYIKWKLDYRNRQLIKYNEEEKYNDLCKLLRNTSSTDKKEELINEFLNPKHADLKERIKRWLEYSRIAEPVTPNESYKDMSNRTARVKTTQEAIKDKLTNAKKEIVLERDTYEPIGFDPITKACQDDLDVGSKSVQPMTVKEFDAKFKK